MADNIKKGKSKPNKKGADHDFDGFDDDGMEGLDDLDFDSELGGSNRNVAKPGIGKEFLSGAKGGFKADILKHLGKHSLPDEFDTYSGELSDLSYFASDTLDKSKSKLKKPIARIAKDIKKFVPESFQRTNKWIDKVIEKTDEYKFEAANEEAARTNQITGELGNIFDKQLEVQKALAAQTDAQVETDRKLNLTNTKKTQDILTEISASTSTQTSFSVQIAKEFYRKSLELQFRSYYVQSDMLRSIKEHYPIFKTQLDGVIKNTGLPDFVKIRMDEKYFEVARTQMMQKINTDVFSNSAFLKNVKKNISGVIEGKINTLTSALDGVADAISGVNDLTEMDDSKSKLGTVGNLVGSLGGGALSEWFSKKVGAKIKPHVDKSRTVNIAKNSLAAYATSPQSFLANLKEMLSDKKTELDERAITDQNSPKKMGLLGRMKNRAGSFVAGLGSEAIGLAGKTSIDKDANKESILTTKTPAVFDQFFYRSVTHVIPLYLANILRENKRLGDKFKAKPGGPLMEYNYNDRKLDTAENVSNSYSKFIKTKSVGDKVGQAATGIVSNLKATKLGTKRDPEQNKKDVKTLTGYMERMSNELGADKVNYEALFGDTTDKAILAIREASGVGDLLSAIKKQSEDKTEEARFKSSARVVTNSSSSEEIKALFATVASAASRANIDTSGSGLTATTLTATDEDCLILEVSFIKYIYDEGNALTVKKLAEACKYAVGSELFMAKVALFLTVIKAVTTNASFRTNLTAQIERSLAAVDSRIRTNVTLDPDLIRAVFNMNPGIFHYDKITSDALINMRLGNKKSDKGYSGDAHQTIDYNTRMEKYGTIKIDDVIAAELMGTSTEKALMDYLSGKTKEAKKLSEKMLTAGKEALAIAKEFKNAKGDIPKQAALIKRVLDTASKGISEKSAKAKQLVLTGLSKLENVAKDVSDKTIAKILEEIDKSITNIENLIAEKKAESQAVAALEATVNASIQEALETANSIKTERVTMIDVEIKALEKSAAGLKKIRESVVDALNALKTGDKKEALKKAYSQIKEAITTFRTSLKAFITEYEKQSEDLTAKLDANIPVVLERVKQDEEKKLAEESGTPSPA